MNSPVIVALDFPEAAPALSLAERLDPNLCRLKVGKELFTAAGPQLVDALQSKGFELFLDLKFETNLFRPSIFFVFIVFSV